MDAVVPARALETEAAGTPRRALPREWWFVALFSLVGVWVYCVTPIRWARADAQLYQKLAGVFAAGLVVSVAAAYCHALLRGMAVAARRAWRLGSALFAGALALGAFTLIKAPDTPVLHRSLESAALGAALTGALLTIFLPAAGLLSLRGMAAVLAEFTRVWLPLVAYNIFGGFCLTATRLATPQVWDPVLLRMDLSLGFNASAIAHGWRHLQPWSYALSDTTYPLLGLMIAAVAARLQVAGAVAHARRFTFAAFLVAILGLACYRVFPAVGPIHAFPSVYRHLDTPAKHSAAAAAVDAALTGAPQVAGPAKPLRNVMPSLHVAFTLVTLAAAWSWRRRFFWQCLPVAFLQIATTLTLAVHYLVDLLAAVPLAALCWWIADRGVRATPHPRDEPLPALALHGPALATANLRLCLSLAAAAVALITWGSLAPVPAWCAWSFAALVVAGPAWTSLRVNRHARGDEAAPVPVPPPAAPIAWRVQLLTAAVFCSGGIALVLEQIYEKYLSTLLGASRPASTIVLTVYFTGLALGAWWCPKKNAGARRRLAALELFIAAWAVFVVLAFFTCDRALGAWLAATGGSVVTLAAARTLLAACWILPPTLAMGAQLPTLAAVLSSHRVWHGRHLTHFYAVNLAGAFAFTVLTPPLLFNPVGADGALWTIAVLGLLVGLALWFGLPPPEQNSSPSTAALDSSHVAPSRVTPLLAAFAAGFGFFALEVVWFHLIGAVCGASVYGFTILLAVVLLGLALGGRAVARGTSALAPTLGWLVVALALGSALWPRAGWILARVQGTQRFEAFWAGEFVKFCTVAFIVLPAATRAGRIFPHLLRHASGPGGSRTVGHLSAANVLGCIAGALGTAFGLIPALGAERTLQVLALAAAGAWLALVLRPPRRPGSILPGLAGLLALALMPRWDRLELTRGYGVYLRPHLPANLQLEFFREDFSTGFVTVVSSPVRDRAAPVRTLLQNGKFDADDAGEMPAQLGLGLVAALHAPARDRALVIGCGSGQTAGLIARLGFAHLDLAELSPAHLAAAREQFSHINAHVLDRPNVTVHVEDGRNLLLRSPAVYDVIQIEVTSVWFAGATNLYSRDFYALARSRLAPGGVLAQWVQLHHLTSREIATILATAQAEFSFVSVWQVGSQACLLASGRAPALNPAIWQQWRRDPALFDERLVSGVLTPEGFAATELLSSDRLRRLLARTPVTFNTDRNRWLEFQTPKYYLSRRDHQRENLRWLTPQK